jgi:F-type H+-transporting ATPase subunit a
MTSKINTYKRFTSIFLLIFSLFIGFSNNLSASEPQEHEVDETHVEANPHGGHETHEANGPIDISAIAIEHVSDSHSWHFWGEGHHSVSAPLPVILKGNNGITFFMSSEFHHDNEGKVVVEKNGERFVMFEEKVYFANETPNEYGQYVTLTIDEKEVGVAPVVAQCNERTDADHIKELYDKQTHKSLHE